ncbi:MAG TPA: hypothetical protein VFX53_04625 [Pedococcus sp.]|nr:hypothetical protein [Pedococcus sp.]
MSTVDQLVAAMVDAEQRWRVTSWEQGIVSGHQRLVWMAAAVLRAVAEAAEGPEHYMTVVDMRALAEEIESHADDTIHAAKQRLAEANPPEEDTS